MKVLRRLSAGTILAVLGLLALYGCGAGLPASDAPAAQDATATPLPASGGASTPSPWVPPTALVGTPRPGAEATLTAAPQLRRATLVLTNSQGESYNMTVEVADTPASQQLGLMFRSSLPLDAGMLFDFGGNTTEGFWMQNTILPLSVAFIEGDGTILDVFDMQPLDTNTTSPSGQYHYALETNQGYFRAHGLNKGDHVLIPSSQGMVLPGMPPCSK